MRRALPLLIAVAISILGWMVTPYTAAGAIPERAHAIYIYTASIHDAPEFVG